MVFKYNPGDAHEEFVNKGYVHLKDLLDDGFLNHLQSHYQESLKSAQNEKEDWKVYGKKRQYLFDFPSDKDAIEFRDGMAALLGYDKDALTISERHLKVYDAAAEDYPAPHKDRAASSVSIGLPVFLPEGSTVCVFPELDFGPNPEERAVFMTDRDHPDLAQIYELEKAITLNEKVGDLVVFLGSSIFHERVKAAGAAILYIKVNQDGRDPLGENIFGKIADTESV
ncbi:MAG: hypothetical protein ACE37M_10575 [Henriciella sp.]